MNSAVENKGRIIIYQTPEGETELEVKLERETLWLNQYQLADLFETDRTSILKHIRNIYETSELPEISTCAKFAQVRKNRYVIVSLLSQQEWYVVPSGQRDID